MSHSITSRRGTTRRRRRASRIGSPPVRRLVAQRAPQIDPLAVARLLVAARAPRRRRQPQARHQLVELRELARLERVEARVRQALLVACQRQRHLARRRRRRRRLAVAATATGPRCSPAATGRRRPRADRRRRPSRRWQSLVGRLERPSGCSSVAEHLGEHAVEGRDLGRVGDEHGARRPVQPPAAHRPHERQRPRQLGRARRA